MCLQGLPKGASKIFQGMAPYRPGGQNVMQCGTVCCWSLQIMASTSIGCWYCQELFCFAFNILDKKYLSDLIQAWQTSYLTYQMQFHLLSVIYFNTQGLYQTPKVLDIFLTGHSYDRIFHVLNLIISTRNIIKSYSNLTASILSRLTVLPPILINIFTFRTSFRSSNFETLFRPPISLVNLHLGLAMLTVRATMSMHVHWSLFRLMGSSHYVVYTST